MFKRQLLCLQGITKCASVHSFFYYTVKVGTMFCKVAYFKIAPYLVTMSRFVLYLELSFVIIYYILKLFVYGSTSYNNTYNIV